VKKRFTSGWGGRRKGAGRPRGKKSGTAHRRRAGTNSNRALHVTLRVRDHVYNLRSQRCLRVIEKAFRAWRERDGFRLVHFSVMGNHLHLVAEAKNRRALARAMQGIAIRIAKGLNVVMGRKRGRVFAHRYYNRVLHTAREVRNVLAYVLNNARRHRIAKGAKKNWVDEFSSAHAFNGWLTEVQSRAQAPPPVVPGKSLLMQTWRHAGGRIAPDFVPGPKDGFGEHPAAA
jgi:REP element-mobilizing transposase RayT